MMPTLRLPHLKGTLNKSCLPRISMLQAQKGPSLLTLRGETERSAYLT
ncbi:hypothetical protein NC652_034139 [Populus alba x Populus x berolinensis]|nr:hypothetical protein NC652_034139 [Populus alba x Populus x berolinensis]